MDQKNLPEVCYQANRRGHAWAEQNVQSSALKRIVALDIYTWERNVKGAMATLKLALDPENTTDWKTFFESTAQYVNEMPDDYALSFIVGAQHEWIEILDWGVGEGPHSEDDAE